MDTLGSMKAMLGRYIKDDEDDLLLGDAINDAIESLWRSILLVHLGQFMAGPISSLVFGAGSERATLVSIPDPTLAPSLNVITTTGSQPLTTRTIQVGYTYVTESGSTTMVSPLATQVVPTGNLLKVLAPAYASGAIGWFPYASDTGAGTRLAQQSALPLDFSQFYVEPDDTGIIDDPGLPAAPLSNTTADDIFYIRLIQQQQTDMTWKTWQGGNLDDLLMTRAAHAISGTSLAQPYAYDFINGRTVELRPAAGTTLNPRHFYVQKPRRLRFDQAVIPFTNISATEFVKVYAAAQMDRTNREFDGAAASASQAERVRMEILQGINTEATTKQKTITPYFNW